MVARKGESYKEARNMDNFTECVNINNGRAGWDYMWVWTLLYKSTAE